ncbi:pentatricopeptide repeat-containing protein At2g40240, mitochondrial-like [Arachis stenosperma]|uniref:pentatricopeptide repeat-containing protein At2g40240, mitochondrial-like n=1 Tax=Arachis stenosperma TaxID=217475 RepID=UPI0025ABE0B0|nr:pentatricopeptide repeat-containing protein At2g40240, mitochondrial-like [Arachis stenosperma]
MLYVFWTKKKDLSLSLSDPLCLSTATHSSSITDIWLVGKLTNATGSSGDFHALRDALNKRIQDNCFNTKSTFDFVTDKTFSSSLLNYLLQTLSTLNRGVTRKNAFDSLITRLCKLQRVDDALHVIEYMVRTDAGGCRPSANTFYPVLNILTRQKVIDHARRIVDFMSTLGVNLDLTGHNYFLIAHCYVGDVAAAARVWKKMEEDGIGADARTFDALVLDACKVKKVDCAMMLVRRMVDDGVLIRCWDIRCRFDY